MKKQIKDVGKATVYFWTFIGLGSIITLGYEAEKKERRNPSPPVLSFYSRWLYRDAKSELDLEDDEDGIVDWSQVGSRWRSLVERMEDPAVDGKDLHPQLGDGEGDIMVEGIGKMGMDISQKPEPWRRAYYEALTGAGRAAEHLEGWLRDKARDIPFPPQYVPGPSNPRPKPTPYGAPEPPREEDCEPYFEKPETFYMKVLTTHGFSTRQRLDAALAYADWLDFKELSESAGHMYRWALDIATKDLPSGTSSPIVETPEMIDCGAPYISSNILHATASIASHLARKSRLSDALPVYVSLLKIQQSLPPSREPFPPAQPPSSSFFSFLDSTPFPPAPPSGNEQATFAASTPCEQAAIMAHIGEILYASSLGSLDPTNPSKDTLAGVAWTRSAVELAAQSLRELGSTGSSPSSAEFAGVKSSANIVEPNQPRFFDYASREEVQAAKGRCVDCLKVGLGNWQTMLTKLQQAEEGRSRPGTPLDKTTAVNDSSSQASRSKSWSWFWGGRNPRGSESTDTQIQVEGRWAKEMDMAEEEVRKIKSLLRQEGFRSRSN